MPTARSFSILNELRCVRRAHTVAHASPPETISAIHDSNHRERAGQLLVRADAAMYLEKKHKLRGAG